MSKTEQERELVGFVEPAVDKLVRSYGGDPQPIPPGNIHFVSRGAIEEITDGEVSGGLHNSLGQYVVIEHTQVPGQLAVTLAHELLHQKSYKAAQVAENGSLHPYRSGLRIFTRREHGPIYFEELEEAVVSEVTDRLFENELRHHSLIEADADATDRLKSWIQNHHEMIGLSKEQTDVLVNNVILFPEAQDILEQLRSSERPVKDQAAWFTGRLKRLLERDRLDLKGRSEERNKLYTIIDEIVDKTNGEIDDREAVFELFARANFSGNIMPLARLVENTLGKGSFRSIANDP